MTSKPTSSAVDLLLRLTRDMQGQDTTLDAIQRDTRALQPLLDLLEVPDATRHGLLERLIELLDEIRTTSLVTRAEVIDLQGRVAETQAGVAQILVILGQPVEPLVID